MDKPPQAEPESAIDDLLLFPLTPEDTDPPIQVEPELPPIEVIPELPPQQKYPIRIQHPPDH